MTEAEPQTGDLDRDRNRNDEPAKRRKYFVNGERFATRERELTVREILEDAGFTPAEEYRLTCDEGHRVFDGYDAIVPIRDGQRFTATFLGPTPTS